MFGHHDEVAPREFKIADARPSVTMTRLSPRTFEIVDTWPWNARILREHCYAQQYTIGRRMQFLRPLKRRRISSKQSTLPHKSGRALREGLICSRHVLRTYLLLLQLL